MNTPTRLEAARAVSGCAAIAEHDARVAERNGLHGTQLEGVQKYARTLRRAANLLLTHVKDEPPPAVEDIA